jgi:hypothetical protein
VPGILDKALYIYIKVIHKNNIHPYYIQCIFCQFSFLLKMVLFTSKLMSEPHDGLKSHSKVRVNSDCHTAGTW